LKKSVIREGPGKRLTREKRLQRLKSPFREPALKKKSTYSFFAQREGKEQNESSRLDGIFLHKLEQEK